MNIATRIHILYDVFKGLHYLHSLTLPLIHRDLTAPNILLTEDLTAKIGDLGVSRYVFCDKGFFENELETKMRLILNVGKQRQKCKT